jgi:hypothetical protein
MPFWAALRLDLSSENDEKEEEEEAVEAWY